MITRILDAVAGKAPLSAKRSNQWPQVRENYIKTYPSCAVCGGTKHLNVHHIQPFHTHPELELDLGNLITLCESTEHGVNCHLWFGHLGNFRDINPNVVADTKTWSRKFKNKK